MGRLHHLAETLPRNIFWNSDYSNLEFILLDYNSPDGLADWIKEYMTKQIESGVLVYYRYNDALYYRYSHSRNMLVRLASGDIVCNLDADNFTGKGFAVYLAEKLKKNDFMTAAIFESDHIMPLSYDNVTLGCFGRIAVNRSVLLKIGGYNEDIEHWGFEDTDLIIRLRALGYKPGSIDRQFLFSIPHNDLQRGFTIAERESKVGKNLYNINEKKSREKIINDEFILNKGKVGCGTVFKNFSKEPIIIGKLNDHLLKDIK